MAPNLQRFSGVTDKRESTRPMTRSSSSSTSEKMNTADLKFEVLAALRADISSILMDLKKALSEDFNFIKSEL
jgi:tagatose-1,6-bisphosphate aldolase